MSKTPKDKLEKQFEYAIAIIGISIAFAFFIYTGISNFEMANEGLERLVISMSLIVCGALICSILVFSLFIVLYGLKLSKINILTMILIS